MRNYFKGIEKHRLKGNPDYPAGDKGTMQGSFYFEEEHLLVVVKSINKWESCEVAVCGFIAGGIEYATRCPTWNEMCFVKDMFWSEDEVCIQYHPDKKNYMGNVPGCNILMIHKPPFNVHIPHLCPIYKNTLLYPIVKEE